MSDRSRECVGFNLFVHLGFQRPLKTNKVIIPRFFILNNSDTYRVMAQVTIGSTDDPHSGAILDLQSTTQGFKLPTVSLTELTDFGLPLVGTSTLSNAMGMMVYNNNPETKPGIYVWDGSRWYSLSPCFIVPDTPKSITFSAFAVVRGATFTASVLPVSGASSYAWTLPDGLSSASSITVTAKTCSLTGGTSIGSGDDIVVEENPNFGIVSGVSGAEYKT
jgi:hypothetical protein